MIKLQGTKLQGTMEYPKDSNITIRSITNKTNGKAYGQSYLVTVPGKVTGLGRQRKGFSRLTAAQEYAAKVGSTGKLPPKKSAPDCDSLQLNVPAVFRIDEAAAVLSLTIPRAALEKFTGAKLA